MVKTPELEKTLGPQKARWNDLAATPEKVDWQAATSLVNGHIPLDASTFRGSPSGIRFRLESAGNGPVTIQTSSSAMMLIWMDGERLDVRKGKVTFEQKKGVHDMLMLPWGVKDPTLKVDIIDVAGSKANASFQAH
jgi:hypothetical protein